MGIIRVILAISVVMAHSGAIGGFKLLGGHIAVQTFYIISGFYMTLILNEKYINTNYMVFIKSRLLRLYPIYWVVLLLTLFSSLLHFVLTSGYYAGITQVYFDYSHVIDFRTYIFLFFTNAVLLFQDTVMFLGLDVNTGKLFFTNNFLSTSPGLYHFLLVPQAWSIGVEITFYLIAPFIVRRKITYIYLLMLVSLMLRIILYYHGLQYDPWTYRFFPTELLLFLLGTVGYHFYKKIEHLNIKYIYLRMVYFSILLFILVYSFIPYSSYIEWCYLLSFFFCLPFVFMLSKDWKKDRYIGELSYPIYISHMLVLFEINEFSIASPLKTFIVVIITIIISILLNEFIAKKIEKYRQSRINVVLEKVNAN